MHEVHLVRALIETVEEQAAAQGTKPVKQIKIRFNPLTSHSAEHVRFSFDLVKQESRLARNAELLLTEVPPLVLCLKCGHRFEAPELPATCPKCEALELQSVNPTEMILEGFELER